MRATQGQRVQAASRRRSRPGRRWRAEGAGQATGHLRVVQVADLDRDAATGPGACDYHSHSLDCGSLVLGTVSECGDTLDIMGLSSRHVGACQKERLRVFKFRLKATDSVGLWQAGRAGLFVEDETWTRILELAREWKVGTPG